MLLRPAECLKKYWQSRRSIICLQRDSRCQELRFCVRESIESQGSEKFPHCSEDVHKFSWSTAHAEIARRTASEGKNFSLPFVFEWKNKRAREKTMSGRHQEPSYSIKKINKRQKSYEKTLNELRRDFADFLWKKNLLKEFFFAIQQESFDISCLADWHWRAREISFHNLMMTWLKNLSGVCRGILWPLNTFWEQKK